MNAKKNDNKKLEKTYIVRCSRKLRSSTDESTISTFQLENTEYEHSPNVPHLTKISPTQKSERHEGHLNFCTTKCTTYRWYNFYFR